MNEQTCSVPPELTEDEIDSILDGDVSTDLHSHLEHCAYCSQRVAEARNAEEQLREKPHPKAEALIAFAENQLAPDTADSIALHVARCRRCKAEIDAWQLFSHAVDNDTATVPQPHTTGIHRTPEDRLIFIPPEAEMREEAMRGPDDDELTTFRFEAKSIKHHILLSLQWSPLTKRLTGFLLPAPDAQGEEAQAEIWDGTVVYAQQETGLVDPTVVGSMGNFQLEGVQPGSLNLSIAAPDGRRLRFENLILPSSG